MILYINLHCTSISPSQNIHQNKRKFKTLVLYLTVCDQLQLRQDVRLSLDKVNIYDTLADSICSPFEASRTISYFCTRI